MGEHSCDPAVETSGDAAASCMSSSGADAYLGDVCVLGAGRTGYAVCAYLSSLPAQRVSSVTLIGGNASRPSDDTRKLEAEGVRVVLGTEEVTGSFDLAVVSPGIPESSAFFKAAQTHATDLVGEPEFAWRESPQRWVALTGTNGKTTTTLLTTALLNAGGYKAQAVGNVGVVATGEVANRAPESWFVAELSSFQLATSSRLHPRAAALLNVTPDHLEWHGSMERYAAAKEKVFANLDASDLAVVSDEDEWCRAVSDRLDARGLRVCRVSTTGEPSTPCAAFLRDGMLVVRLDGQETDLVACRELKLSGRHNMQNALVASALALGLGVGAEQLRAALRAFEPLEHRTEPCGELGGVSFVNDSKATNVDSVEKALTAFEVGHVVVLLGGHDKGTELESLVQAVQSRCRVAVCYGEAGERIAEALERDGGTGLLVRRAPHMREALALACSMAQESDTVLLSPACSSFDEFTSYTERGRVFKELVAACVSGKGKGDAGA